MGNRPFDWARNTVGLHHLRAAALTSAMLVAATVSPASAQGWNIDVRPLGLGGIGGAQNIFTSALTDVRGERTLPLPFGLARLLGQRNVFKASSADFNPLQVLELVTNPLHAPAGPTSSSAATLFVHDIRNGSLNPNLNAYRGFAPKPVHAQRVIAPRWGKTFAIYQSGGAATHRIFVGAGPQLGLKTALEIDGSLLSVLTAVSDTYVRNSRLSLGNQTRAQIGMAITGGYRGEFALRSGAHRGYVMLNANHLRGFRLEDLDTTLALQTDAQGLVGNRATTAMPLSIARRSYTHGTGASFDFGAGISSSRWDFGISAQNVASRMNWRGGQSRRYSLADIVSRTSRFAVSAPVAIGGVTTASPALYRANAGFRAGAVRLQAEAAYEWDRLVMRLGGEGQLGRVQVRGASSVVGRAWLPAAGLSVPVSRRLWLDASVFSSAANVEQARRFALATSIRLLH